MEGRRFPGFFYDCLTCLDAERFLCRVQLLPHAAVPYHTRSFKFFMWFLRISISEIRCWCGSVRLTSAFFTVMNEFANTGNSHQPCLKYASRN